CYTERFIALRCIHVQIFINTNFTFKWKTTSGGCLAFFVKEQQNSLSVCYQDQYKSWLLIHNIWHTNKMFNLRIFLVN
ncbi:hypothetical protein, partial [Salmonella enterica]|uniref:hypothetical protein n=1 Tax=Salmonella enterica TaxID=28901 RepID=UPI00352612D7